jgi:hypothetical protein
MRVSIAASRRSRLGEAAALTGVDLDEGNAGRAKAALEGEMIGTGRLEDDALDRRLRGPLHERPMPALVVGEATARAVGQAMSAEMVFRHIDPDGIILPSLPRLCSSFGARPRVSVQAEGKDEGDPTPTRPVKRSANSRSVPRRFSAKSHETSELLLDRGGRKGTTRTTDIVGSRRYVRFR